MQKTLLTVLVLGCGLCSVAAGQPRPDYSRGRYAGVPPSRSSVERWADRLADELDHLQEDLYYERGDYSSALIRTAEQASRAAAHFQEVLGRTSDREHLLRDFQELDRQVHQLLGRLERSGDSWLNRQASRIRYADEQLHYLLRTDRDGGENDKFRELLARHAHVLENQARQLEQLVERFGNRGGRGDDLLGTVRDYTDEAEHFHQVVERGADRQHLREDFREVDDTWRQVVSRVNTSPYGLYLRRAAQLGPKGGRSSRPGSS